eukprot:439593_1
MLIFRIREMYSSCLLKNGTTLNVCVAPKQYTGTIGTPWLIANSIKRFRLTTRANSLPGSDCGTNISPIPPGLMPNENPCFSARLMEVAFASTSPMSLRRCPIRGTYKRDGTPTIRREPK